MLFNSYIFIFLFLPLSLAGFFLLNHWHRYRLANGYLIGMSLWFYGYFNPSYLWIICGSIVGNFLLSQLLHRTAGKRKKAVLAVGTIANVAVIFYFKYFNFFLENINALFGQSFVLRNIVLPLGISFFTFQQISYLVDSYRGQTKGYRFDEYALFVSFFPQLIAGPIVLHNEVIPQFRDTAKRRLYADNLARGLYIFALGLFKKVILADTFAKAADFGFGAIVTLTSLEALLVSLSYTFQLYFDFSGYCDMALGLGAMFNIDLPQNFNSPYKATSITDFWARWHMSLTRFLRMYVYFPLGGNRKGKLRTYFNIMLVYLVSGIWHGANWTFILWGVLHGALNCLNRIFRKPWQRLHTVTQWFFTFMAVNVLWILFRADTIADAIAFYRELFRWSSFSIRSELYGCFTLPEFLWLEQTFPALGNVTGQITGFHLWAFFFAAFFIVLNLRNSKEISFKPTLAKSLTTVLFLFWSIISLAGVSTFLYFNF